MADTDNGDAGRVGRGVGRAVSGVRAFNRRHTAVDAIRRLRRALPGDPGFGDPLSAAGRDSASVIARIADRLYADQPRVTQEIGLGALQVWHSVLERAGGGRGDAEVSILFTDLVGFSSWALAAGDDDALQLLRDVASAVEPAVSAHRGKVVKRLGDGLMAVFPSPQLAFEALVDARARLDEVEVSGYRPRLRAGVHTGTPRVIGGDYVGVDVNIAARLAESAGADETLVSDAAMAGLDPERVSTRRRFALNVVRPKGVPRDVSIHSAAPRGDVS